MKRILSLFLVLASVLSGMNMTVFSAPAPPPPPPKLKSISISASSTSMRVGEMVFLNIKVNPSGAVYERVEWFTLDEDIIRVNDYGDVESVSEGSAHVYARVFGTDASTGKEERLANADIELTVNPAYPSEGTASIDSVLPLVATGAPVKQGRIPSDMVVDAVKTAVKKGSVTSVTFRNYESVSASALASSLEAMKKAQGTVLLNFDALSASGGIVEGRVTINPQDAVSVKGDIGVSVGTNSGITSIVRKIFEKFFSNAVTVVKVSQEGSYGMDVTYAAKIGSALSGSKQLKLYSYDMEANRSKLLEGVDIRLDANGYAHFTTPFAGYLIISDGILSPR